MLDGCATEIAWQQDGAEDGSLANPIEGRAGELENSQPESQAFRESEMGETFHDRSWPNQFHDRAEALAAHS